MVTYMSNQSLEYLGLESQQFLIDAHVHLHPSFGLEQALSAARRNMNLHNAGSVGVLMLTEMPGVDRFSELSGQIGPWEISETSQDVAVIARHREGAVLVIIVGHQIVTRDGIEVLMLGAKSPVSSDQPVGATIAQVLDAGALSVLPWGVGKWSGARGQLIADKVAKPPSSPGLFLADTGVRMHGSARPTLMDKAENSGWRVLAGTDPLPLASQCETVGRFGFVIHGALDVAHPFTSLKTCLWGLQESPQTYGSLQGKLGFCGLQLVMQLRKRFN